jgi:mono/diheme cytochrome c family protein
MRNLLIGLILFLFVGIFVVWFGVFNVAATEQHGKLALWVISVVRDRSIAVRATASPPEPSLTDAQRIKTGFRSYHTMCAVCHSAPGRQSSPVRQGLNPKPPRLYSKEVQRRSNAELYWIIQHGMRMTGMPAFGPTHSSEKIWSLLAFMRELPKLSPQQYKAMVKAEGLSDEMADADADQAESVMAP